MKTLKEFSMLSVTVFLFLIGLSSALDFLKNSSLDSADGRALMSAALFLTLSISLGHVYFLNSFSKLKSIGFLFSAVFSFLGGMGFLYALRQDYFIISLSAGRNLLAIIGAVFFLALSIRLGHRYFIHKRS